MLLPNICNLLEYHTKVVYAHIVIQKLLSLFSVTALNNSSMSQICYNKHALVADLLVNTV